MSFIRLVVHILATASSMIVAAVKVMPLQLEFWYQRMDDGRTVGQLLFLVVHRQVTGLGQFL